VTSPDHGDSQHTPKVQSLGTSFCIPTLPTNQATFTTFLPLSLFLERSRINDVSAGRRAINASRGAAPLCRPHEHDLLCVQGTYTSGYGCTASNSGEREPPLSGIDVVGIPVCLRRNPYCSTYSSFGDTRRKGWARQQQQQQQH
jgi:hypothetical protein